MALLQGSFRVHGFSPVTIIPPVIDTRLHLHVTVTRRTKGRSLWNFQISMLFCKLGSIGRKSTYTLFLSERRSVLDHVPINVKFIPYKLAEGWVFFEYFCSSFSVSFHQYSTIVFTCMLLSLERHKHGAVWLLTKRFSSGNRGAFVCKLLPLFPSYVKAVLYLLLSSAEFSQLRAGFERRQAHVLFVLDKVALRQTFIRLLRFSSVSN